MPIPPDTRAPGDAGHVTDHNNISDTLTAQAAAITAETSRATAAEALLAPKASPTFTGTVTVPATVGATDAAQKQYVDSVAAGLNAKPSVKAAATSGITLSGAQTIDGVSVAAGDRVLAAGQGTASQNGVWVAAAGAWTRPADFAAGSSQLGAYVFVEGGTVNGSSGWVLTGASAVTVDTTAQTWTQFSGTGEITAGTGLTKSGNTLSLALATTDARYAQVANNLSDVASKPTARDNLGAFKIVHAKADFNVVGDGVADDTTNLQAFFTAIGAGGSKAGYKGYLPPGTYKVTSAIAGASLTQCAGGGKYVTTIKQWTAGQDILQFTGSSGSNMLGVELSDFSLTGPYRVDKTGTATHSSTTVDDTHATASDLGQSITGAGIPGGTTITAVTPGVGYTISAAATTSLTSPALTIAGGSAGTGLNLNYWLDTCSAKRMIIQGNSSHGVQLQNSYLISFEHVWHYNNGGDGLHAVTSLNAVKWDNCEFFGNAGDGAYVNGVAGSLITGCDFESNGKHGLETTNCYVLTVEANDFENNGTSSPGSTYAAIYVGSTNGYAGPRITGNNFTGTAGQTASGVELSASVTSAYLEGNAFNNFAGADILADSGATGIILAPNNIHQAGSEPLIIDNTTGGVAYIGEQQVPFSAVDAGYKAWNYDFALEPNMNSTTGMTNYTAGVIFGARIQVRHVMTVSKISVHWTQPTGGSPANCFLALYDSTGSRKGVTADLTSTATGLIQPAFAGGAVTLQPGYYYVAVLIGTQGGTQAGGVAYPTLTLISSQATGYQGAGLSASQYRFAKMGNLTAQTSMPSSITLASNVAAALPFGCAVL